MKNYLPLLLAAAALYYFSTNKKKQVQSYKDAKRIATEYEKKVVSKLNFKIPFKIRPF